MRDPDGFQYEFASLEEMAQFRDLLRQRATVRQEWPPINQQVTLHGVHGFLSSDLGWQPPGLPEPEAAWAPPNPARLVQVLQHLMHAGPSGIPVERLAEVSGVERSALGPWRRELNRALLTFGMQEHQALKTWRTPEGVHYYAPGEDIGPIVAMLGALAAPPMGR